MSDVVVLLEQNKVPDNKGKSKMAKEVEDVGPSIVSHIYPADCPNILTAMKSIITSFVSRREDEESQLEDAFRCKAPLFYT